jgi:hypothetical protein
MKNVILYLLFILSIVLVYGLVFSLAQGINQPDKQILKEKKVNYKSHTIIFNENKKSLNTQTIWWNIVKVENVKE